MVLAVGFVSSAWIKALPENRIAIDAEGWSGQAWSMALPENRIVIDTEGWLGHAWGLALPENRIVINTNNYETFTDNKVSPQNRFAIDIVGLAEKGAGGYVEKAFSVGFVLGFSVGKKKVMWQSLGYGGVASERRSRPLTAESKCIMGYLI